jgi:hypothetical protein
LPHCNNKNAPSNTQIDGAFGVKKGAKLKKSKKSKKKSKIIW